MTEAQGTELLEKAELIYACARILTCWVIIQTGVMLYMVFQVKK
jgi:hypothetical protein